MTILSTVSTASHFYPFATHTILYKLSLSLSKLHRSDILKLKKINLRFYFYAVRYVGHAEMNFIIG